MTFEEAQEELKSYRYHLILFDQKLDEIARMQSLAERMTSILTATLGVANKNRDRIGECASNIADLKNDLVLLSEELTKRLKTVQEKTSKLKQPYRTLLDLYYIEGKSLIEVAEEIGYSYRQTKRILRKSILLYKDVPLCP